MYHFNLPSTIKKNPFVFFFSIFIAFPVISDILGSPFELLLRSTSYCMCEFSNKPMKVLEYNHSEILHLYKKVYDIPQ